MFAAAAHNLQHPCLSLLQVLLAGLSAAQNSSESVRELAFLLVLSLAQHHSSLFEPLLDLVLQPLLQGCGDESREVRPGIGANRNSRQNSR